MAAGNNIPCLAELNCTIFQESRTNQTKTACNVFYFCRAEDEERASTEKAKEEPCILRARL